MRVAELHVGHSDCLEVGFLTIPCGGPSALLLSLTGCTAEF
jgi:hypothetical protein